MKYKKMNVIKLLKARLLKNPLKLLFETFGMEPTCVTNAYSQYNTPFRESHSKSLFVRHDRNFWYDTGMKYKNGRIKVFGDSIDFIIASLISESRSHAYDILASIDVGEKIDVDLSQATVFQERLLSLPQLPLTCHKFSMRVLRISDTISDLSLLSLLSQKHIPVKLASEFCYEAVIEQGALIKSVDQFLLFPNTSGGYLAINKWEIKTIGEMDISFIKGTVDGRCYLFTHQFDYLAFMTLYDRIESDIIICNNNGNYDKAINMAGNYHERHIFLRRNSSMDWLLPKIHMHHWNNTTITIGAYQYDSFEEYLESKKNEDNTYV